MSEDSFMEIINGKELARKIKDDVKEKILKDYTNKGKKEPCLVCVIVGNDKASEIYVKSKQKACEYCGIKSLIYQFPEDTTKDYLIKFLNTLNENKDISGILVQLPLPKNLDKHRDEIINTISPSKDVDCLTHENLGKMFANVGVVAPCTATGIIKIIDDAKFDLDGKDVVVIGRSLLVGKSVSTLLQSKNATVTNCHSHTKNLKEKCQKADVLVVAVGKARMIKEDFVKQGAFVVDVGINRLEDGHIVGDVDFENVKEKCSYITPVPGGVGPLTVACLMENTLILHEKAKEKEQVEEKKNTIV